MTTVDERAKQLAVEEGSDSDKVLTLIKKFFLKAVAWFGIYLLGLYDFSFAWLLTPLLLSVLRQQWRKERNGRMSAAREAALTDERTMIRSRIRVEDLPSWVFFPDKERAEWINSIIHQIWANVGNYTRKIIVESVEPAVRTALEGYGLHGFHFDKVVLGQVPPRITGVKVYDKNTSRNEIIMDVDLIFASNCDVKFGFTGVSSKISDLGVRGPLRVVFKPLINDVPLIGGLQVYFLTNPEIDFNLGGIANALDTPGLNRILRRVVQEQIANFIVLPNKFTMSLSEKVHTKDLKCPDSAGVLRVSLKKAEKLAKKDFGILGMGKSDPYATLRVGARSLKTEHVSNTVNPEWNFVGDFPIEVVQGQELNIEIWDFDPQPGEDEFLGKASIATGLVARRGQISDMWVELEDIDTGRVLMSFSWLKASDEADEQGIDNLAQCLLHVYVDSCENLEEERKLPSPLVELKVGTGEPQVTGVKNHTLNPVFEQGFVFLVTNPNTDDLVVRVMNSASASKKDKDKEMGTLTIPISKIMSQSKRELTIQPFPFSDGKRGTIVLSAQVKYLKDPVEVKSSKFLKIEDEPKDLKDEPDAQKDAESKKDVEDESEAFKDEPKDGPGDEPKIVKSPSLDEVISSTVEPIVKAAGMQEEMVLRKRTAATTPDCGKVKMTFQYDEPKKRLDVIVHEAVGLPGGNLPDPPDPYVKLYLLPERSRKSKRKSDAVKDTVEPVFEETFGYDDMELKDMLSQKLEVSISDKKGIFSKGSLMGRTVVDLADVINGGTNWYPLEEDDDDSD